MDRIGRVLGIVAVAWFARGNLSAGGDAATASRHWAFEPVRTVDPPADPSGRSSNPVDSFIAARLRAEGLQPVAAAGRRALIRRACCDLIGLPPEPAEVEAFVADASEDAFENLVDRLLASPHFGDQAPLWELGQVHRLPFTRPGIGRTDGELVFRAR